MKKNLIFVYFFQSIVSQTFYEVIPHLTEVSPEDKFSNNYMNKYRNRLSEAHMLWSNYKAKSLN